LLCAHGPDKAEAKNGDGEEINTTHGNGGNVTVKPVLCTNRNRARTLALLPGLDLDRFERQP
jgi:hypothetical protein